MRRILFIAVILMTVTTLDCHSKSYYNSVRNQFGGLYAHPAMQWPERHRVIDGERLIDENLTAATAIMTDTMGINSTSYRYQMRMANLNNKQGKTVSVKDPVTGAKEKLTSTKWGLVFNHDNNGNYCAVVLNCDNSAPYNDITDQRTMLVTVVQHYRGSETELARVTLDKGISLEDDLNTLCVDVDDKTVVVSMGKDELRQVLEVPANRPSGTVRAGYLVGAGARLAIERAVLTIRNEKQVATSTTWTLELLNEHFKASSDPVEGYWKYLDRDMEDKWLRLGGRYTIAVVGDNHGGYDLIYIDGAQVKKSQWQSCMMKGHMSKTIFSGNYDLTWIDATMEPIDKDAYASIENGVILTLSFPVYKSQVRFAKVLTLDD